MRFIVLLLVLWFHCTPSYADTLEDGADAWDRGDYAGAVKVFQPLAAQGNVDAQSYLCDAYLEGRGLEQDYTTALPLCRKAAQAGDMNAEASMGAIYWSGEGVDTNKAEAFKWYSMAAEQGLPFAQYMLSVMYAKGEGVRADRQAAYKWAEIAENLLSDDDGNSDISKMISKRLDQLSKDMTPAQIAEGRRMANEWLSDDLAKREQEGHTSLKLFFLTFLLPAFVVASLPGRQLRFHFYYRLFTWMAFSVILPGPMFAVLSAPGPLPPFALAKAALWAVGGALVFVYAGSRCSAPELSYLDGLMFVIGGFSGAGSGTRIVIGIPLLIGVILSSLFIAVRNDILRKSAATPAQFARMVGRICRHRMED